MKDHGKSKARAALAGPSRMSVAEAARRLGVCNQTVRNLAHAGRIKWFWGGGKCRPSGVLAESVEAFLRAQGEGRTGAADA